MKSCPHGHGEVGRKCFCESLPSPAVTPDVYGAAAMCPPLC